MSDVTQQQHHEPSTSLKRKAEADDDGRDAKKGRAAESESGNAQGGEKTLKRDRERCTVFIAGLPSTTEKGDVEKLFKECGAIYETKLTTINNDRVASVEFTDRESVLVALTRDKKRLHDQEISVYQAWQSTLYVTNFPEKYDDEAIRELFGKYGPIFDVRWPSKRIKTTRRFCYVQYITPSSAQSALILDSFALESDRRLSVAISNPEKRKERTDADADAREVHVGGLARGVGKSDLEGVFGKYGPVKDVRIALDDQGRNKGFAFVEFQDTLSATAALGANNTELKKRRIAVTLADSRAAASKKPPPSSGLPRHADSASRKVYVSNLPPQTSEPLLQQALEKVIEKIVRVSLDEEKSEAMVELQTAADASKMVLLQGIQFQDHQLTFTEAVTAVAGPAKGGRGGRDGAAGGGPRPKPKVAFAINEHREDSAEPSVASKDTNQAIESSSTFAPPAAFVPRSTGRGRGRGRGGVKSGLGFTRGPGKTSESGDDASMQGVETSEANGTKNGSSGGKDQDAFRRMLGA